MEGIRAGWNKALRTIYGCCWNASEQNSAACWALMVELAGGKKAAPFRDRAAGTTGFILRKSRTAKAPPRDDATRKIKSSIAAPRILAPSITAKQIELRASRDRDYILQQKRNRRVGWKVRIA